ncbi:MAG: AAA family ATPase, partial [Acidimicrobiales bacterium]
MRLPPDDPTAASSLRSAGVSRGRLEERLAQLWHHRLTLVTAPAGSGKTTLVTQFAAAADVPTVWYRADGDDASLPVFLARLQRACALALGPFPEPWSTVAAAADALADHGGRRVLLVVDDLHAVEASETERGLEQLLGRLPGAHAVLAASRRPPRFNLSRLRVSGDLLELGPDDLRFRIWEVERLFRDVYGQPLAPEELAELARRTEGWAAGLHLFHLATRGKPPTERRRMLQSLGLRSRLVREYLAQNVLDELPDRLRRFLIGTCTLGRLNAALCDELLGISGSREILDELERTQMFTYSLGEEGWYRYHEVLRSHLEVELSERHGQPFMRAEYQRAAGLLEAAGAPGDALRAYCCAEDWAAAARLLGRDGEQLVDDSGPWFEGLPPAVVDSDPWLLLASARRFLSAGRLRPAIETYRRAEAAFGPSATGESCRRERQVLTPWIEGQAPGPPGEDWLSVLRSATHRDPEGAMARAARLEGPSGRFARAVAAGLAGREAEASRRLLAVAEDPRSSDVLGVTALTLAAAFALLCGEGPAPDLDRVADSTEDLDVAALTRVGRGLVAVAKGPAGRAEAGAVE